MSKSEFGRRINRAPQTVQDIFNRKSIDTDLLIKISDVLEFNFFSLFRDKSDIMRELDIRELRDKVFHIAASLENIISSQKDLKDMIEPIFLGSLAGETAERGEYANRKMKQAAKKIVKNKRTVKSR